MPAFILHPQLENDSLFLTSTQNIQIRLVKDSRFFWLILYQSVMILPNGTSWIRASYRLLPS